MWRVDKTTGKRYRDLGDGLITYQGFEKFLRGLRYVAGGALALMTVGASVAMMVSEHPPFVFVF